MTVVELGVQTSTDRWANVSPYTYRTTVNISKLAYFWLSTFGCEDERTKDKSRILSVIVNYVDRLAAVMTLEDCKNTFETWYFDYDEQILYVNFGTTYSPNMDVVEYLRVIGFCDTKCVSIGDVQYLPVITGAPTISTKQDLINYNKLSFSSGSVKMMNENGVIDGMAEMALFSNDVVVYYLKHDERDEYEREELEPISGMYLYDIKASMRDVSLEIKDVRQSLNVKLPNHLFNSTDYPNIADDMIGKPIPLMYGQCVSVPAICTNSKVTTGSGEYRFCELLTALGTVQVEIDSVWTTVTPTSYDLATGSVVLAASDARAESGDDARKCRMLLGTGITNNNPGDVIIDMNYRANGITYIDSFYDTTEFTAECATLEPIAMYIEKQTELNELIRQLQEGSSNRFRYEYNSELLRTIRLDNPDRASVAYVAKEQILENDEMEVYTDRKTIAAFIEVEYAKDYEANTHETVIDGSNETAVARSVRETPTITFETFLTSNAQAQARATIEAERLGQIRRFTQVTLRGEEFLGLRIYDIITVELMQENREWLGIWKCQVIGTSPNLQALTNKVTLVLVDEVVREDDNKILRVVSTGEIRRDSINGDTVIREV